MRKITREISTAFLDSRSLYRDNTTTDGSEIRLFGNLIAYWDTDFTVAITLAGWNTATTRERLNGLLELMNVEKRIVSKGGVPYMSYQNRVHFKRIHLHGHYTVEYDFLSPENYARITGEKEVSKTSVAHEVADQLGMRLEFMDCASMDLVNLGILVPNTKRR